MLGLVAVVGLMFAAYRLGLEAAAEVTGSADLIEANLVSVAELGAIADNEPVFYQGSNRHFHYFRVEDAGYFKMRLTETNIPQHGFVGDGSGSLGMIFKTLTIEAGKLKAGDAPTGGF